MNSHRSAAIAVFLFAFCVVSKAREMNPQKAKTKYPHMASVEEYLMPDRTAEIALARSAAPESISARRDGNGVRKARVRDSSGRQEWICMSGGAWVDVPPDAPEFWNPKLRGPICFNPPTARSVLPTTYKRTEMVLAGRTKAEIIDGNKAAFE